MLKQVAYFGFGTLVIGMIAVLPLILLIVIVPSLTFQLAYDASLFIPNKLGLTEEVTEGETAFANTNNITLINLTKIGRYRIYSPQPIANHTIITLTSQDTEQQIEITPLHDFAPSDEVRIKTKDPQYIFNIDSPGTYKIEANAMNPEMLPEGATLTVKPYVGNYNATIAFVAGFIQACIIIFIIRLVTMYFRKPAIVKEKDEQNKNREQFESFYDQEMKEQFDQSKNDM